MAWSLAFWGVRDRTVVGQEVGSATGAAARNGCRPGPGDVPPAGPELPARRPGRVLLQNYDCGGDPALPIRTVVCSVEVSWEPRAQATWPAQGRTGDMPLSTWSRASAPGQSPKPDAGLRWPTGPMSMKRLPQSCARLRTFSTSPSASLLLAATMLGKGSRARGTGSQPDSSSWVSVGYTGGSGLARSGGVARRAPRTGRSCCRAQCTVVSTPALCATMVTGWPTSRTTCCRSATRPARSRLSRPKEGTTTASGSLAASLVCQWSSTCPRSPGTMTIGWCVSRSIMPGLLFSGCGSGRVGGADAAQAARVGPTPDEEGDDREDRHQGCELHRVHETDLVGDGPDDERAGGQTEEVVGQGERAEGGRTDRRGGQVRDHGAGGTGRAAGEEGTDRDEGDLQRARTLGEAEAQRHERDRREDEGSGPLADRDLLREAVRDDTAHDHADAHEEDEPGGCDARLVGAQVVRPVEVARETGEECTGHEELQAAAHVGADHSGGRDEGAQLRTLLDGAVGQGGRDVAGVLVAGKSPVVDEDGVEGDEHEAEDRHQAERPAPAELDREDPAEEDTEHGAERAAGHEGTGERRALGRREDHEHDRQADAAVGRLTEADEEAGEHHLVVAGREGAAQGGKAPETGHQDDGLRAAPTVTEQRQRDGEQAHRQRDDARERAELGVGEGPLDLEEGEDGREHLARHVVGQEKTEGQDEDGDGEEPGPSDCRRRGGRSQLRRCGRGEG